MESFNGGFFSTLILVFLGLAFLYVIFCVLISLCDFILGGHRKPDRKLLKLLKPGSIWYFHLVFDNPFQKTISYNVVIQEIRGDYVLYKDETPLQLDHSMRIFTFLEHARLVKAAEE